MGILIYQIGIFIAIQIAAFFGKSSRNVAIILISIFTVLQVYTSQLMILQFLTIIVSYFVAKNFFDNKKENSNEEQHIDYEMNKSIKNIERQNENNENLDDAFGEEFKEQLNEIFKNYTPPKRKIGRERGQLPNSESTSTNSYGLSKDNPILMSSIPSSYRFLDKIVNENNTLNYQRRGSTKSENFENSIDIYEFKKNNEKIGTIYVYPYYNSNVEIIPNILK